MKSQRTFPLRDAARHARQGVQLVRHLGTLAQPELRTAAAAVHCGRLDAAAGEYPWYGKTARSDVRLALAWNIDAWTFSAAWTEVRGDRGWYGTQVEGQARALSASVAYHF